MIRTLEPQDIDAVVALWLAASLNAHDFIAPEYWQSQVAAMRDDYLPNSETYVFERDGSIQGFVSLHEAKLAALFVAPEAQGAGMGSQLLARVAQRHPVLQLRVYEKNPAAIRFYVQHGFRLLSIETDGETGERELLMDNAVVDRQDDGVTFAFGDSPEMADDLLARVLAGQKTATCGALAQYADGSEPLPRVGRQDTVLDGAGRPACIIETSAVDIQRFEDVSAEFAVAEGEGTYDEWREGHRSYFERNGGFDPRMVLVCQRFVVAQVIPTNSR